MLLDDKPSRETIAAQPAIFFDLVILVRLGTARKFVDVR
jgi:hypothetical protein